MTTLQQILSWLDGKKTYIFGILALTNAFLGLEHVYGQNAMAYIQAIISLLSGGAEAATVKLGARK